MQEPLKVKELIELLKECNQEAIVLAGSECCDVYFVNKVDRYIDDKPCVLLADWKY